MQTPRFFNAKNKFVDILVYSLFFITVIYVILYIFRCYYRKIFAKKITNKRIICIGNVVLGGSGKTEIALAIGRELKNRNITFCYLTKGYGRSSNSDLFIEENAVDLNSKNTGDEAILLSEIGDVFISKNRNKMIKKISNMKYDYIITDDGLHDSSFFSDIKIAVFDANYLDGNKHIVPFGPLRCPYFIFENKIDCIIFTNASSLNETHARIIRNLNCKRVFVSNIAFNNDIDKTKKYIAFAGLGINEKFFNFLRKNDLNITQEINFSDHYFYTQKNLEYMLQMLQKTESDFLLTTKKDIVKIDQKYLKYIKVAKIEHKISGSFFQFITN